jgi:hypothetical protein
MDLGQILQNLGLNIVAGILTAILIALFLRRIRFVSFLRSSYRIAIRLHKANITAFQLSRDHYSERLPAYLGRAKRSIEIISITLKVPNDEGGLVNLFIHQIEGKEDFRITISLLDPFSETLRIVAKSLDMSTETLLTEICAMLKRLFEVRDRLPPTDRSRLRIVLHDSFPMGSAILLDATPDKGTIQVETKLYKTSRLESFGYEVGAPSEFYTRNYRAWKKVLDESHEVTTEVLKTIRQKGR